MAGNGQKFGATMVKWVDQVEPVRLWRLTLLELFSRIVERTPVRDGFARGSWTVGEGSPLQVEQAPPDPSGAGSISRGSAAILTSDGANPVYFAGNVPYMDRLEHGWSQQAPAGMAAVTLAEAQDILDRIAQNITGRADQAAREGA